MNKFKLFTKALIVFVLALATMTVFAGLSVGFSSAGRGSIIVTVTTTGNFDSFQVLVQGSNLSATCTNKGGNNAPGRNPVSFTDYMVTSTSAERIPGTKTYTLTSASPLDMITATSAGCPNGNWRVSKVSGPISISVTGVDGVNGNLETFNVTCPNYNTDQQVIVCQ